MALYKCCIIVIIIMTIVELSNVTALSCNAISTVVTGFAPAVTSSANLTPVLGCLLRYSAVRESLWRSSDGRLAGRD